MDLKRDILINLAILISSIAISYFITGKGGYEAFIIQLPEIISILTAATVIAFILILSKNEDLMEYMAFISMGKKFEDHIFHKYLSNVKKDFIYAFSSLFLSFIAIIISGTIVWKIDISLVVSLVAAMLFIGSVSDIIRSFFILYELKYLEKARIYKIGR